MKSVLKEINRLAEKKTGTNPKKKDIGDTINYMSENMTGVDPKEKTVAKALKYYVDNYVSGGNEPKIEITNPLDPGKPFTSNITKIGDFTFNGKSCQNFFRYHDSLTDIDFKNFDTSGVTITQNMFMYCQSLKSIPLFDTSSARDMSYMFQYCASLEDVPLFNTSSATSLNNMFSDCPSLTDESLDNILQMCINSRETRKTLGRLNLTPDNYPVSRIEALPHYQDFIDAGWTIGY